MSATSTASKITQTCDVVVVGAGVAGLCETHHLRKLGFKVQGIEAGSDVGGTWYWNRYPGCRFDSQTEIYQFWFDEALNKAWEGPRERFGAQPDNERWLQFSADFLDLRRSYKFDTRVESAHYNESTGRWLVTTDKGDRIDTQFFVSCAGMLSAPLTETFKGQSTFKGKLMHTARWPKEPVDLTGKRVGVVGVGATGIQVIQTIASQVGHLTVFVLNPNYITPMRNPKYGDAERADFKTRFGDISKRVAGTFGGFDYDFDNGSWHDATPEQRRAVYERLWADGSLSLWLSAYPEIFVDKEASDDITAFVREKMQERLKSRPDLWETLIPSNHNFGIHRVPLENGYLEAFLRPNVTAVNCHKTGIVEVVPEGVKTSDGKVHELDVLIMATGFDAGTGALTRMDIRGRGGRSLKEDWSKDIRSTMGLQVHGYPNLFTTGAPLAPAAALCNMTTCLQQQAGWIADTIGYMRDKGYKVMEPTAEKEAEWVKHHDDIVNATLFAKSNSWYMGSNVPGKPRRMLSYAGGVGTYRQACEEVKAKGYEGFSLA